MVPLVWTFPYPDPVAFRLGPLAVHWYGIMYLASFLIGYWLLHRRLRHRPYSGDDRTPAWPPELVGDLIFYLIVADASATACSINQPTTRRTR